MKWYADFKERERVVDLSRSKWDDQRDLIVEFDAINKEHARARAFEIAYDNGMTNPFMGTLKQLEIEEKKGIDMRAGQRKLDISGPVLSFLQNRAGKTTSIDQLVKATGFADDQIRSSISYYRSKETGEIETLVRGKMWRWNEADEGSSNDNGTEPEIVNQVEAYIQESNEPEDDEKGFYLLTKAKDGALILQRDCDGTIWKAEQL